MITQQRVKELFDYVNGNLIRKIRTAQCVKIGDVAGSLTLQGYMNVRVDSVLHRVHRVIFLYHKGYLPEFLDHINGIRNDNRIENLRECTRLQNAHNRKVSRNSTSKLKGVNWYARYQKWSARVCNNGKRIHLGYFDTLLDATAAIFSYRRKIHGEFTNNG